MTLPVKVKTWTYDVNRAIAGITNALATNRTVLMTLKDRLKALGVPWTVRYSCSSTVAGAAGDGVDRWAAITDLVWANAGSAHSWIVLRQTGITATFELLISCEGSSANGVLLTVVMSPSAGFTGGTTTARPTATDEVVVNNGGGWIGSNAAITNFVLHIMQSNDGQCTRGFIMTNNNVTSFFMFEKPQAPVTGWSNPVVGYFGSQNNLTTNHPLYGVFCNVSTPVLKARGSATMDLWIGAEACSGVSLSAVGQLLAVPNDLSGEYPLFAMSFVSTTASHRGKHGIPFDMWWTLEVATNGDTFPNDASRQFAVFGDFVVPWNGTSVLTA